jgi:hypothetical protein
MNLQRLQEPERRSPGAQQEPLRSFRAAQQNPKAPERTCPRDPVVTSFRPTSLARGFDTLSCLSRPDHPFRRWLSLPLINQGSKQHRDVPAVIGEGQPKRLVSSRLTVKRAFVADEQRFAISYQPLTALHHVTAIFGNGVIVEEFACQIISRFRHHLGAVYANPKAQGVSHDVDKYDVPKDVWKIDWVNIFARRKAPLFFLLEPICVQPPQAGILNVPGGRLAYLNWGHKLVHERQF